MKKMEYAILYIETLVEMHVELDLLKLQLSIITVKKLLNNMKLSLIRKRIFLCPYLN